MSHHPILALTYTDSARADETLRRIALALLERGWNLAGLIQHNQPRPGRSRCDMVLEELASGALVAISEDRGPSARGCALEVGQLLHATEIARAALQGRPDAIILNKFGKAESEGGGFRDLIAEAIETGIPLLIAVPFRNLESWRAFSGDLAREIPQDAEEGAEALILAHFAGVVNAASTLSDGDTGAPVIG